MNFLKIREQIHKTGFDEFYQAGTPNKFSKMNVVAISKALNKQFWICVGGGYRVKDTFFIAFRPLDNTKATTKRIYCDNQASVVSELVKISEQIKEIQNVY